MVDEVNPLQSNCAVKRSKNIQKHYKSFSALNGFEESIIERTTKERNLVEQVASNSNNNSSNTALPRLANALKSLLSSNGGFFKSKSVCVDAGDELIYYSNGSGPPTDSTRKSPLMPISTKAKTANDNDELQDENFLSASSTTSSSNYLTNHHNFTTLEQIRQLYKSMPNFAESFDNRNEQKQKFQHSSNSFNIQFNNNPYSIKNVIKNNPLQVPQRRKLIAAFSDRSSSSSLSSSAKSAISVPLNNTGENMLGECAFYSSSIERVAEQCEKTIPVSTTIKQFNNSPSISSCISSSSSVEKCQQKSKLNICSKNRIKNYKNESTDSGYLSNKSNHNTVRKTYWPTIISWLDALEWIYQQKIEFVNKNNDKEEMFHIMLINPLTDFKVFLVEEENFLDKGKPMLKKRIEWLADLLFNLLDKSTFASYTSSLRKDIFKVVASTISTLFRQTLKHQELNQAISKHYFRKNYSIQQNRHSYKEIFDSSVNIQVDQKFVDCPDLSDIRFRCSDGHIVYAHRIVLVNASEEFRQILKNPSGIVDLPNSDADTFRLILEFVYGNVSKFSEISQMSISKQMAICTLARSFGLKKLVDISELTISSLLHKNIFSSDMLENIYAFAMAMNLNFLMEECERYTLLNFFELLPLFFDDRSKIIKNEHLLIKMKEMLLKSLNQN